MELNILQTTPLDVGQAKAQNAARKAVESSLVSAKTREQIKAAAEEFEALFISQMLTPMFNTIPTDGPMGGGHSEMIYRSMMVDEMGKATMKKGGIGIADHVMREILRAQEELAQ